MVQASSLRPQSVAFYKKLLTAIQRYRSSNASSCSNWPCILTRAAGPQVATAAQCLFPSFFASIFGDTQLPQGLHFVHQVALVPLFAAVDACFPNLFAQHALRIC